MTSRTYKDYPSAYFKILDHFASSKTKLLLKNESIKELHSRRRDLTRFFSVIANTENDAYVNSLYKISRELTISLDEKEKTLTIKWNEINSMLEEFFGDSYTPPEIKIEQREEIKEEGERMTTEQMSELEKLIESKNVELDD